MTLPTFFVAGTARSATTTLYQYLRYHPEVFVTKIKEPRFFAFEPDNPDHATASRRRLPIRTLEEYEALYEEVAGEKAIGEASPQYLYSTHARRQIHAMIPDARLVFCLRNPAHRAYSEYLMSVNNGRERRPFAQVVAEDTDRIVSYAYYAALTPWFQRFEADQIKVVLFEDVRRDIKAVMQGIYRFLGADDRHWVQLEERRNMGGIPKSASRQAVIHATHSLVTRSQVSRFIPRPLRINLHKRFYRFSNSNLTKAPALPNELRAQLTELFCSDTEQLEGLLERNLSAWKANA